MSDLQVVDVNWDNMSGKLTIEPSYFELKDEKTWVQWKFHLPPGQIGFISFATPFPRLGPFYSLRTFTDPDDPDVQCMLGKGNKGAVGAGTYQYLVLVLDLSRSTAIARGEGSLKNLATRENTAPEVYVTYSPPNPGDPQGTLEVTPDPVGLNTGDTVTWYLENLPPDAFACFQFKDPDGKEIAPPFIAFNACKGDGQVTVEASATGFAVAIPVDQRPSRFGYCIQLRDWEGQLLASHEPVIDNLGPPAPGDDGPIPPEGEPPGGS